MRTSTMNRGLKLALALLTVAALGVSANADDKVEGKKIEKAKAPKLDRAAEKRLNSIHKTQTPVEGFESVDMFQAMESGDINVLIKTRSSANSNLMIKNTSNRPLAIKIPPAFAGVPVMRQIGGGGGGGRGGGGGGFGGGGGGQGGGGQGVGGGGGQGGGGGGFGGGGGGRGGGGGGGGIFNIPPGREGKININTVCLEHGKAEPRARMDYKVVPIENVTTDPEVLQIIQMMANDEITQNVAQAATWNQTDKLTWEYMLTKNRVERMDGYYERFFSRNELVFAHQVVQVAAKRVEELSKMSEQSKDTGDLFDEKN